MEQLDLFAACSPAAASSSPAQVPNRSQKPAAGGSDDRTCRCGARVTTTIMAASAATRTVERDPTGYLVLDWRGMLVAAPEGAKRSVRYRLHACAFQEGAAVSWPAGASLGMWPAAWPVRLDGARLECTLVELEPVTGQAWVEIQYQDGAKDTVCVPVEDLYEIVPTEAVQVEEASARALPPAGAAVKPCDLCGAENPSDCGAVCAEMLRAMRSVKVHEQWAVVDEWLGPELSDRWDARSDHLEEHGNFDSHEIGLAALAQIMAELRLERETLARRILAQLALASADWQPQRQLENPQCSADEWLRSLLWLERRGLVEMRPDLVRVRDCAEAMQYAGCGSVDGIVNTRAPEDMGGENVEAGSPKTADDEAAIPVVLNPCWELCGHDKKPASCHPGTFYGAEPPAVPCLACRRTLRSCEAELWCCPRPAPCGQVWADALAGEPGWKMAELYLDDVARDDVGERAAIMMSEGGKPPQIAWRDAFWAAYRTSREDRGADT